MKRQLSLLLSAVLCLTLALPLSALSTDKLDGVPQFLRYGGSEYECISSETYQRAYPVGTAYVLVAESGENYYALGTDLKSVPLTLNDGILMAESGVAEIVPEASEHWKNFNDSLPAKIGTQYLTITELNGPLALTTEKAFQWHFASVGYPDPLAVFYGSISTEDTSISGCVTFEDGVFGTTQWGNMQDDHIQVFLYQRVCEHAHPETHPAVAASCAVMGNNAYSYCPECATYLNEAGEYLYTENESVYRYSEYSFQTYPTGHHYVNGVCTHNPSHIALDYEPVTAEMDLFEDGYLYIIAAPDNGDSWKVMDINPAQIPSDSIGCTAVMGADGKLRIDNTADGTRSAAEFRLTPYDDVENLLLRVPVGAQYGEYDYGMWAPDNGSSICSVWMDSGYMLMDQVWQWNPDGSTHHPYSILIREDGIAEIQMLTFTQLLYPMHYGPTKNSYMGNGEQEITCFYAPWEEYDGDGTPLPGSGSVNVQLFRAKAPVYSVGAQILSGTLECAVTSETENAAFLVAGSYDADGRMRACEVWSIILAAGDNQFTESFSDENAAEFRVFLLDDSLRPLSPMWSAQAE